MLKEHKKIVNNYKKLVTKEVSGKLNKLDGPSYCDFENIYQNIPYYKYYNDEKGSVGAVSEDIMVSICNEKLTAKEREEKEKELMKSGKDAFYELQDIYRNAQKSVTDAFVEWLYDEYGDGLPKPVLDIIYAKAYDDGHSSGYGSITSEFIDLMEFAQNILKAKE